MDSEHNSLPHETDAERQVRELRFCVEVLSQRAAATTLGWLWAIKLKVARHLE